MGWGGRWAGGSGWGAHVHPWLIPVTVWQKPPEYCKVISLQLKKKQWENNNNKKKLLERQTEKTHQWCELDLILKSDWLASPPTLIAALTHFLLTTNKLFPLINYKLPRGRFILAHVPHLDCGLRWWNWWEDVWNWAEVVGVPRSLHPPHGLHTVARSRERPVWEEAARWEGLHWPSCTELTPGLHLHCEQLPNV